MDEPYKNREIDEMFGALRRELLDENAGILPRIERQTIKTNGRVTRLERAILILITGLTVFVALKYPQLAHLLSTIGL